MTEVKCQKCGKMFIPAPMHSLRDDRGFYCKPTCFLHRQMPRGRRHGNCKTVAMCDRDGNVIRTFPSALNAAEHIGADVKGLREACIDKSMCRGYRWKYVE